MPAFPRGNPTGDPQQRNANKLAELDRRVRTLERNNANTVQHSSAFNSAGRTGVAGNSASMINLQTNVTVTIPDTTALVLVYAEATLVMSNNTTTIAVGISDDIDFVHNVNLANLFSVLNTTTSQTIATGFQGDVFTNWFTSNAPSPITLYSGAIMGVPVPTVGDHTYALWSYRSAGAGTVNITDIRLTVLVL